MLRAQGAELRKRLDRLIGASDTGSPSVVAAAAELPVVPVEDDLLADQPHGGAVPTSCDAAARAWPYLACQPPWVTSR